MYLNPATETVTKTFTSNVAQKNMAKYLLISIPILLLLVLGVRFYYTFELETQLIASFYSMQVETWKRYSMDEVKEQIEDSLANRTKYHYGFG